MDDEDDLIIFLGPLPTPVAKPELEDYDELGRLIPKPNAAFARRERRTARLSRRQVRQQRSRKAELEEGYSTDSSLPPPDTSAYSSAITSLALRTKEVLADVRADEFRDPGKGRWSAWREKYSDSYIGAWGGLGVVSVWEFWVRLEIVGWDCIEVRRVDISEPTFFKMSVLSRIQEVCMISSGTKGFMNTPDLEMVIRMKENWDLMGTWWLQ